jgi:hypothetical protein
MRPGKTIDPKWVVYQVTAELSRDKQEGSFSLAAHCA